MSAGELRTATRSVWRPSPEALVASLVFVLSAVAITVTWERLGDAVTDIALYQTYGERLAGGLVPYRDFGFEYPPGALPAIVLPALVTGTVHAYRIAFVAELALVGVVAVLLLDAVLRRLELPRRERILSLAVVALAPLLLGGVILTRFDLVPAALVLAALALAVAGRRRAAALVVGVGAAVKLYPALLLPPLAIDAWRRGGRRELAIVLGLAVAPVALAYILQIESVGAGLLLALPQAFGMGLGWTSGSGSQNLTGTGAGVLAALQGVVQVVAVVLVWVAYARGPSTAERLVRYGAASVVAFVALSKVLSPQFLVWLVLLVPLVGGPRRRTALALTAVACALTAVWFPARYWDLVRDFDPLVSWLVLLRGLVLLGLLAALTWPATEPAPSRSPSPVPSPGRT